jgi:hypothetical protein
MPSSSGWASARLVAAHQKVEAAELVSTYQGWVLEDLGEAPVKYMILIHSNPASREIWDGFTDDQRAEGFRYYAALGEELTESGEMIASEALADPSLAKRVSVRDGQPVTSDGPFAEAKEHLAGFFLLDCASAERAVEIAARVPEAGLGLVEVRPVLELGAAEL